MKASELIKALQDSIEEHGDQDVELMVGEEFEDVRGVVWGADESGKVDAFLIADNETFLAFADEGSEVD